MAEIDCLQRIANVLRVSQPGKIGYNPEKVGLYSSLLYFIIFQSFSFMDLSHKFYNFKTL